MIDLILWSDTKTALNNFAKVHGLLVQDPETQEWATAYGVEWSWWQGSGKMLRSLGTYDAEGVELTPPTFVNGWVILLRLHSTYADADKLDPAGPTAEDIPEWDRSKVARFIRNNGTPGTVAGLTYYEIDGVRILRVQDVEAKLAEWGVPSHRFA